MPWIAVAAAVCLFVGCAGLGGGQELAFQYNAAARHHGPDRNPIIAIPGILGSKLRDRSTGTIAWGAFEPGAADPGSVEGARLIGLPIADGERLRALRDEVEPSGVLENLRIRMAGIPLEVQAYAGILSTLGAGGYRDDSLGLGGAVDYGDDHFTCFQFAYDWRRDNVENAQRLHAFILEKREYVKREYRERYGIEDADVRFDIAAHSMGGLLTRYFLMYGSQDLPGDGSLPELSWEGAGLVDRVIFIGTPNAGSAEAFLQLVEGWRPAPILPRYPSALLGTLPAIYQLLPRTRHVSVVWDEGDRKSSVELLDPAVWRRMGWGLAAPDQAELLEILMPETASAEQRRRIALALQEHVLEYTRRFMAAMDRPAETPDGLELFLVAGDRDDTLARIAVDPETGALRELARGAGDGTVLRSSALLDERVGRPSGDETNWSPQVESPIDFHTIMFLPDEHLALTTSEVFRDNVLFWLLEDPR